MTRDQLTLDEMDSDEDPVFPPPERKVVTQPYDLSIQTLAEQWESGLLILPDLQREYVWNNGKASRLVESLLLNIPIPILYFAENEDAQYEIIDGHQRIKSVVRFLNNEFRLSGVGVLHEYKGRRYHQLPEKEQRFLKMRTLRAVIIGSDSHPTMRFEIFERLNSGSISLNSQELRNSLYRGSFNQLLRRLAKHDDLRFTIDTKSPRRRMVDEELLLRFFALHQEYPNYKTPLKRFLNEFMAAERDAEPERLDELESIFQAAISLAREHLGECAFRVTDSSGKLLEKPVNRALFDSQMLAFSWVTEEPPAGADLRSAIGELCESEDFLDSVQRATGDRSRTRRRVRMMCETLRRSGFELSPPYNLED